MTDHIVDANKMVPLSPAAQAVLDAFLGDAENTGLQMDDMRENVAAALRAAASQLTSAKSSDKLRAIAAELEGHA